MSKRVLITGGDKGIGKTIVEAFVLEGCQLACFVMCTNQCLALSPCSARYAY